MGSSVPITNISRATWSGEGVAYWHHDHAITIDVGMGAHQGNSYRGITL